MIDRLQLRDAAVSRAPAWRFQITVLVALLVYDCNAKPPKNEVEGVWGFARQNHKALKRMAQQTFWGWSDMEFNKWGYPKAGNTHDGWEDALGVRKVASENGMFGLIGNSELIEEQRINVFLYNMIGKGSMGHVGGWDDEESNPESPTGEARKPLRSRRPDDNADCCCIEQESVSDVAVVCTELRTSPHGKSKKPEYQFLYQKSSARMPRCPEKHHTSSHLGIWVRQSVTEAERLMCGTSYHDQCSDIQGVLDRLWALVRAEHKQGRPKSASTVERVLEILRQSIVVYSANKGCWPDTATLEMNKKTLLSLVELVNPCATDGSPTDNYLYGTRKRMPAETRRMRSSAAKDTLACVASAVPSAEAILPQGRTLKRPLGRLKSGSFSADAPPGFQPSPAMPAVAERPTEAGSEEPEATFFLGDFPPPPYGFH